MMTAERLMQLLLELDQQYISGRPSPFGEAALLVRDMCRKGDAMPRSELGDWESVEMSQVRAYRPPLLNQPILSEIERQHAALRVCQRLIEVRAYCNEHGDMPLPGNAFYSGWLESIADDAAKAMADHQGGDR
jgi:hypothetical protein